MPSDLSAEETVVIATYSNRQDAEVDKARLNDQNVSSFVVADDVHPPLQLTEGVELRILTHEARRAHEILETGPDSAPRGGGTEMPPDAGEEASAGPLTFSSSGFVQATAWTYVAAFLLMVTIIVVGLLLRALA